MKSLIIPAAMLVGIASFCLWCGTYTTDRTEEWRAALEETDNAAWREDWQAADLRLRQVYESWQEEQTFLHTVMAHDELEEAESLFVGAFAVCREADGPDFHTMMAQLMAVLEHLKESQTVSIRNIF